MASADPALPTGSATRAMAYAAEPESLQTRAPAQVRPMGANLPRLPATASAMPASPSATAMMKPQLAPTLTSAAQSPDSPWMRAAALTPSVSYMMATRVGPLDARPLQELMFKPAQSLVMTFSADPHLGMVAERFSGSAVVFLATATFTSQTQAALR
ncbi:MAG: hypothetical protein WDN48_16220 [Pseudolabrys sp.]